MDERLKTLLRGVVIAAMTLAVWGCETAAVDLRPISAPDSEAPPADPLSAVTSEPIRRILESALEQTETTTGYTQDYFTIDYPNGDVPAETGACTDVVIRAFRKAGVDLQKEVHEDMRAYFAAYPRKWGLTRTDTNIDHRRVPNLQVFFERKRKALSLSTDPNDYQPGDVVSWDLNGKGLTHIGIVSHIKDERSGRPMIIHNIGSGTRLEDRLFEWKITGHFRYF